MDLITDKQIDFPGFTKGKDCFGGEYLYINPNMMSKRKAWNWALKNGFKVCENKNYLNKGNVYIRNNKLLNHLIIEIVGKAE